MWHVLPLPLYFLSVKNIGFGSLSAQRFDDILPGFCTRRWPYFPVNFLYQTLLFRFLGFRLSLTQTSTAPALTGFETQF